MKSQIFTQLVSFILLLSIVGCSSPTLQKNEKESEDREELERMAPQARWDAEFNMIKDPVTGQIPAGIRAKEIEAALKVPSYKLPETAEKTIPTINITPKGPNNYGGRTRALQFDVRDNGVVIAGGVSGGIYRSTNNGDSWTRVTPAGQIHSLTCLAQDPRAGQQDTWYAGTGEKGSSAGGSGATYLGFGIFKSTDNGLTWSPLPNTQSNLEVYNSQFDIVHRMIVNPNDGNLLAATSDIITLYNTTTNTASTVLGSLANSQYGDIIYNSVGNKFYAALHGQDGHAGIHSSSDGSTWTQVGTTGNLNPTGDAGFGHDVERIVLANSGNTAGILAFFQLTANYGFSCSNGSTSQVGLAHYDGSNTWTNHNDKISECAGGSTSPKVINTQGDYNMCLVTKPDNGNIVFLGGVEIYRLDLSTSAYDFIGGSQQGANAINLHVDNHQLRFEPGSNDLMWAANDGGLRRTDVTGTIKTTAGDDNGYDWTSRNTDYVTYQYYDVDISPVEGSTFMGGAAQDNAFTIHPTTAEALEVGPTADGTSIGIISGTSFTNYSILATWQNGGLVRIDNGTQTFIQPSGKGQGFVAQIYLDADNTDYLYYPTTTPSSGLLRTRNASGISSQTITGDASTGWEELSGVDGALNGASISAMDVTRNNPSTGFVSSAYTASDANRKMYIGTSNGKVYRCLNDPAFAAANTSPIDITPGSLSGNVSDIAVNPDDDKEIIVTVSNYNTSSVWHTADASVASPTWTAIEGASGTAAQLASVRSAMIVNTTDTKVYLIGTSTGLYATDVLSGSTTSWTRLGTTADLGLAVVSEMRLRKSDNNLLVGTHGNGMYLLEFPAVLPVDLVSFTGEATTKGNLLNWETASELNNAGFEIERSFDSRTFEKIGFVDGNQTSSQAQSYSFLDEDISEELTYYRLKQLDIDGKYEYSDVISISNKLSVGFSLVLYPNPVVNNLTVENGIGTANITSIDGRFISQVQITDRKYNLNVSNLPEGIYILTVERENGKTVSRQFVK